MRGRKERGEDCADFPGYGKAGTEEEADAWFDGLVELFVGFITKRLAALRDHAHYLASSAPGAQRTEALEGLLDYLEGFRTLILDDCIRATLQAQILYLREVRDCEDAFQALEHDPARFAREPRLQRGYVRMFKRMSKRMGKELGAEAERRTAITIQRYAPQPLPDNVKPFFPPAS